MSHPHSATPIKPEALDHEKLPIVQTILGIGLAVGVVLCVLCAIFFPEAFGFSWLLACAFWFTIIAGCFFWVLVHFATDAAWSTTIRRQLENVACTIPYLGILALPLLIFDDRIWTWLSVPATDSFMEAKDFYLQPGLVLFRTALVFVAFTLWTWRMRQLSVKQDYDGDSKWTKQSYVWAYLGLPVFGLGLTAIAIDWLMTLNFKWFSTMWGVYIFAGAAWAAMATIILITASLQKLGKLHHVVNAQHYHIMGKLLLAFTIFWSYIAFSQYMLIWYANIPEETTWYLVRNSGWWWLASTLLFIGHFIVPFLLLLPRDIPLLPFIDKRNPNYLIAISLYCLFIQALDLYIIIMPVRSADVMENVGDFGPNLFYLPMDAIAIATVGAALGLIYLHFISRYPLFPSRDPRVHECVHLSN
jgi:hypothetical protein